MNRINRMGFRHALVLRLLCYLLLRFLNRRQQSQQRAGTFAAFVAVGRAGARRTRAASTAGFSSEDAKRGWLAVRLSGFVVVDFHDGKRRKAG